MLLAGDYVPRMNRVVLDVPDELLLCNLEAPIIGDKQFFPSRKAGITLDTHALTDGFQRKIFTLANNHIMDFGEDGLMETRAVLRREGFFAVGAGGCKEEAKMPLCFEEKGQRIAILGCCERQFGVAENNKAGVCEMGLWMLPVIAELKKQSNIVIVSCHAALEFSPWPSPWLRSFYKSLIDSGADVIHGHHAHVPQGFETYRHGVIFYGLGNFVVDPVHWQRNPAYVWSAVVRLKFDNGRVIWKMDYCEVEKKTDGVIRVRLSEPDERRAHAQYMAAACRAFSDDDMCEAYWQEASLRFYHKLYAVPLGMTPVVGKRLTSRQRVRLAMNAASKSMYALIGCEFPTKGSIKSACASYNFFNCLSHADAVSTALGVLLGERGDLRSVQTKMDADVLHVGKI